MKASEAETKREARQEIIAALAARGIEAVYGKGGFFVRGQGFVTFAQARKLAAVAAKPIDRQCRHTAYGEYAIFAALNGRLNG